MILCLYIIYVTDNFNILLGYFDLYKDILNVNKNSNSNEHCQHHHHHHHPYRSFMRGDADMSVARPTSRCHRAEPIVSLERGRLVLDDPKQ